MRRTGRGWTPLVQTLAVRIFLLLISVIGLGYIGLPTAAVLASRGVSVIGLDVNPSVVETVNKGLIHIEEPDLEAVVRVAVDKGFLRATTRPEPVDIFVIAVPTPFHDGKPDVSYIERAARTIAPVLRSGNLVILESTSPVGTTDDLCATLAAERPDLRFPGSGDKIDVSVAYCPERVLPGKVLHELVTNDRIIGGVTPQCAERASAFYRLFCEGQCLTTSARTAELCKLTENAFRDVNIAFANELSLVCERLGINVWELIRLANHHPRVNILQPGPGVGGHCIAVDPWFIVSSAPDVARLIRTAREVNDGKPQVVLNKIRGLLDEVKMNANGKRPGVACLGLAFKPDIDDIRESPALAISEEVARWPDCDVFVAEPHLSTLPAPLSGKNHVVMTSAEEAIARSDVVALLVNHRQFYQIAPAVLQGKRVVDTRGMWS